MMWARAPPQQFAGSVEGDSSSTGQESSRGSSHRGAVDFMYGGSTPSPDTRNGGFQQWIATSEDWTTVMLRNLPPCFSRGRLIYVLCKEGFAGTFDFIYVPLCFKEKVSLCYAFINFIDTNTVARFWKHFTGFKQWGFPSVQVAEVCWCARHQGLAEAIDYYRNNSVMHSSVPDECKPVLFHKNNRVAFPLPTKTIKVPKKVKRTDAVDGAVSHGQQLMNGHYMGASPMLTLRL